MKRAIIVKPEKPDSWEDLDFYQEWKEEIDEGYVFEQKQPNGTWVYKFPDSGYYSRFEPSDPPAKWLVEIEEKSHAEELLDEMLITGYEVFSYKEGFREGFEAGQKHGREKQAEEHEAKLTEMYQKGIKDAEDSYYGI